MEALDSLAMFSRFAIVLAWLYAICAVWKHRRLPYANQVLAGALAMVLSQGAIAFQSSIPVGVLMAFIAMAHITLASAFVRVAETIGKAFEEKQIPEGTPAVLGGLLMLSIQSSILFVLHQVF